MNPETADTIPAPNANTQELADELDRLALKHVDKHVKGDDFFSGWVTGVREAADHVRTKGAQ